MDSKSYHKYLVQSAAGGIGFYAYNNVVNNGATGVILFGKDIPTWVAGAGMGLVSAVASELIHHAVLPHIHVSKRLENSASVVTNVGSSSVAWWLTARVANPALARSQMSQLLAMGAITEVAGSYFQKLAFGEDPEAF